MRNIAVLMTIALALNGCGTLPRCPASSHDLSTMFYSGREDTEIFTNAIVYIGYHETTIAPGQITDAAPLTYAPSRLRYAENTCVSYERMNAQLGKTGFVR